MRFQRRQAGALLLEELQTAQVGFVTRNANSIFINAAEIVQSGILVANGLVHILDNVLKPAVNGSRPDVTRTAQLPIFGATGTGTTPCPPRLPRICPAP